jgi:hypothetical protein
MSSSSEDRSSWYSRGFGPSTSRPNSSTRHPRLSFRRSANVFSSIVELWSHRKLLGSLSERQFSSRYMQGLLGLNGALAESVVQHIPTAIDDNIPIAPVRHR